MGRGSGRMQGAKGNGEGREGKREEGRGESRSGERHGIERRGGGGGGTAALHGIWCILTVGVSVRHPSCVSQRERLLAIGLICQVVAGACCSFWLVALIHVFILCHRVLPGCRRGGLMLARLGCRII